MFEISVYEISVFEISVYEISVYEISVFETAIADCIADFFLCVGSQSSEEEIWEPLHREKYLYQWYPHPLRPRGIP